MSPPDRGALIAAVRTALEDSHTEYARMPFFVRPLVKRGFARRTGRDLDGWRRLLAAAASNPPPRELAAALDQLAGHFDGATARARRGMGARPDELVEVQRRSEARAAAVRALVAALSVTT